MKRVGQLAQWFGNHCDVIDEDELRSDGHWQAILATERFRPRRGVAFKTFVNRRLRGAMDNEVQARRDWYDRAQSIDAIAECPAPASEVDAVDYERLRRALASLDKKERKVLEGLYYHQASYRDAKRMGGVGKSEAHRIHHRALGKLRKLLGVVNDDLAPARRHSESCHT